MRADVAAAGVVYALVKKGAEDHRKGLVHLANKKTPYINVLNIVDAGRSESFTTYLRMHNLERPEPPRPNEWTDCHDCEWARSRGLLTKPGFGTLVTYIGITQFADYLDSIPKKHPAIDWEELTITEARFMFKRLCADIGIRPRSFGPFIHGIIRANSKDLKQFGGKKLNGPPDWCVRELAWKETLATQKERHYRAQAARQGRREIADDDTLPAYGSRTAQQRAPRKRKQYKIVEEESSDAKVGHN